MMEFSADFARLSAFVAASLVLCLTPGPVVAYVVARALAQGRAAGLASVFGASLGSICNMFGAVFGLAAVLAVSSLAFTALKWAGAAYLIWIGIGILRTAPSLTTPASSLDAALPGVSLNKLVRDGFWVGLLNPKTLLFFTAFLPQFMRPDASPISEGLMLGGLFLVMAACTDSLYAIAAGWFAPRLRGRSAASARVGQRVLGGTFIGMGVLAVLLPSGKRA